MPTETKTTVVKVDKATSEDAYVLVQYNPSLRDEGELTRSQLRIAASPIDSKGLDVYMLRPGVSKMRASEWKVWESHPAAEIQMLLSPAAGILRKVADRTSIVDIYNDDPYLATEILRHTTNLQLLREWMDDYEQMDGTLRQALADKSDAMEGAKVAPTRFVFGRPVAA